MDPSVRTASLWYVYMLCDTSWKFKICILKEAASKCSSAPLESLGSLRPDGFSMISPKSIHLEKSKQVQYKIDCYIHTTVNEWSFNKIILKFYVSPKKWVDPSIKDT